MRKAFAENSQKMLKTQSYVDDSYCMCTVKIATLDDK